MEVQLIVERTTKNQLNDKKLREAVKEISGSADKRASTPGLVGVAGKVNGPFEVTDTTGELIGYQYNFTVTLKKENVRSESASSKILEKGKIFVGRAAEKRGWLVKGDAQDVAADAAALSDRPPFSVSELTDRVRQDYFGDIYERDAHIRLIHKSVTNFIDSGLEERNHTILYGPAAACKTMLFRAFKEWYEEGDSIERVACINATTISKAGLESWILERAKDGILPDILWFDEIEKFNPDNMLCLLSVMDGTGEIARMNAKIGRQRANARVLVWGTCNDEQKVREFQKGSLWSRFAKQIPCVRPSRELMLEILQKKIQQRINKGRAASRAWAKICVDYAFDVRHTNDPRFILGLLDGGKSLEDGSYFQDIEDVEDAFKNSKTF